MTRDLKPPLPPRRRRQLNKLSRRQLKQPSRRQQTHRILAQIAPAAPEGAIHSAVPATWRPMTQGARSALESLERVMWVLLAYQEVPLGPVEEEAIMEAVSVAVEDGAAQAAPGPVVAYKSFLIARFDLAITSHRDRTSTRACLFVAHAEF